MLLILANPMFTDDEVGSLPLLDWLLPAYLVPALLAVAARREPATAQPAAAPAVLGGYALIAGLCLDHAGGAPPVPCRGPSDWRRADIEDAELWAWSGAWLAYGVAVMAAAIAAGNRRLRLAALAIVGLTAAKVFLVDMSGLVGLWRVLSFLGLGLVLIGLGAAYRRWWCHRRSSRLDRVIAFLIAKGNGNPAGTRTGR